MAGPHNPPTAGDPMWPALTGPPSKKGKNNFAIKGATKGKKQPLYPLIPPPPQDIPLPD